MKLRNMSATVDHVASITLRLENGENLQLENAYVLTSYAFINDFCDFVPDMSAADIRATAKGADDDSPYWFAAGIVEGIAPEYCNCEGCVNFGNEECEHLCALTHRFSAY